MAHNLFNERFFTLRQPAWHGLGVIGHEEQSAIEIFQNMTPYVVTLEPIFTEVNGLKLELPNKVITRHPVPDDPEYRTFGVVGEDYHIVDPWRTCEIWDESTKAPPETLGVLGVGESLFITTKLPTFSVKDEEIESYLLLHNPYGGGAIQVSVTPIRVVCQNTLIAAKSIATESFKIIHDRQVEHRLSQWMDGIVQRAERRSKDLADAFDLLASTKLDEDTAKTMLERIYVDPAHPRYVPDASIMERREKAFESAVAWNVKWREAVLDDWRGGGMGMDSQASEGTAWGFYNAVVEVEDYRPTSGGYPESRSYNSLFGDRAQRKEVAFQVSMDWATSSQH